MSEDTGIHDFDNTVVAILDRDPAIEDATTRLSAAGYDFELLQGESGVEHLDPSGEHGLWASMKRLASALGDQTRILDQLSEALEEGKIVVSVESEPSEAEEAISILRDHGGRYIWKFGSWTFTEIAD